MQGGVGGKGERLFFNILLYKFLIFVLYFSFCFQGHKECARLINSKGN